MDEVARKNLYPQCECTSLIVESFGSCPECSGDGHIDCSCDAGVVECEECEEGKAKCPHCGHESGDKCEECGGKGHHTCDDCYGSGWLDCEACDNGLVPVPPMFATHYSCNCCGKEWKPDQ